ncbi:methionyl-tRNA formyltransferase [Patescibacteria group bacterium]|nr:methionyl-tRNA formyltransferase [Patescibacteria group bacterium]
MTTAKIIIYFGTSEMSALILEKLLSHFKIKAVVTQPDRPSGRKQELTETPVKVIAKKHNLKILQPQKVSEADFLDQLNNINADLGILAAYAELIPNNIIDMLPLGILNVHPSLLPKYRGASPIQHAILNGDKITGVTIIRLVQKLDAGPIVAQKEYLISNEDTNITLHDKLAEVGAEILIEILPHYIDGTAQIIEQDESKMTMTKELGRDAGKIDWSKKAVEIERQFRAFQSWPGIFTHYDKKRLKIIDLSVFEGEIGAKLKNGEVFLGQNNEVLIKCKEHAIHIKSLQMEGKKVMSANDFVNGYSDFVGSQLG